MVIGYARVNKADEEDEDRFYSSAQAVLDRVPTHDLSFQMGEFNAKVGRNEDRRKSMGERGMEDTTDNSARRELDE